MPRALIQPPFSTYHYGPWRVLRPQRAHHEETHRIPSNLVNLGLDMGSHIAEPLQHVLRPHRPSIRLLLVLRLCHARIIRLRAFIEIGFAWVG